jgi:hypothetical protein
MSDITSSISDQKNWSRAYYSILVLSIILIPISTLLGYLSLDTINVSVNGEPIFGSIELPALTAFYAGITTGGLILISTIIEAVIFLQFFFRQHILSVIVSTLTIIIGIVFMSFCQLSILLPFFKMGQDC